jgi:hypothetical protein
MRHFYSNSHLFAIDSKKTVFLYVHEWKEATIGFKKHAFN